LYCKQQRLSSRAECFNISVGVVLGSTLAFAAFALVAVVMRHTFGGTGLICCVRVYALGQCFWNFFIPSPLFTLDTSLSPPKPDKSSTRLL